MPEVPSCLRRRYRAIDDLINELNTAISRRDSINDNLHEAGDDVGVKLMCELWSILKENPDCNLTQAVQQRMGLDPKSSDFNKRLNIQCYMANELAEQNKNKKETTNKMKHVCCIQGSTSKEESSKCCSVQKSFASNGSVDSLPLSKVLCNIKEAASFDKKCSVRLHDLMQTEKQLQEQIQHLEQREKEAAKLMKQADCMWSCMEEAYKKKIAESNEKQKSLLKQLKEIEASASKWRKHKKDLESQVDGVVKYQLELAEKINEKTSDLKCLDSEIADLKKRCESNQHEADLAKRSLASKKQTSQMKITAMQDEIRRLEAEVSEENKLKRSKERDGTEYVKEAREEIKKICNVLLLKKIENENLAVEKQGVIAEIDYLRKNFDQCRDVCKGREKSVVDELKKLDEEISNYNSQCIRCHECTDTVDIGKFCTDCPRCQKQKECHYEEGHCSPDHTMDCVCMSVKQNFIDNVLQNMYTVLERKSKTGPGKAVANTVLQALRRSRNGKLDDKTRKIVKDFVMNAVKKNLTLTVIGGAVKTRCEMDKESYKQLMLCLDHVKVTKTPKDDKKVGARKEPCGRWGGTKECNCPGDPKTCICMKKAPPPPHDPNPCPSTTDAEDNVGEVKECPHKEVRSCGVDCAMHAVDSNVGTEVTWNNEPCNRAGQFPRNMRAAQCVLGPEPLRTPIVPVNTLPELTKVEDEKCPKYKQTLDKADRKNIARTLPTESNRKYLAVIGVNKEGDISKKDEISSKNVDYNKVKTDKLNKENNSSDVSKLGIELDKKVNVNENEVKIQTENRLVNLTKTTSGTTVLALDDDVVALIEDPNLSVSLKKTVSGNYLVNVNSADKILKNKIIITKKYKGNNHNLPEHDIASVSDTSHKCHADVIGEGKILEINHKQIEPINATTEVNTKPQVQTNEITIKDTTDYRNLVSKSLSSVTQNINMHSGSLSSIKIKDEDQINVNKKINSSFEKTDQQLSRKEVTRENKTISLKRLSHNSIKSDYFLFSQENDRFNISHNKIPEIFHDKTTDVLLKRVHEDHIQSSKNMQTQENQANSKCLHSKESRPSILQELTEIYDHGQTKLKVRVNGENGVYTHINCGLTKTLSGNVAIDVNDLKYVGEICFKAREYPVMLTRDLKGKITLDLTRIRDYKDANSVLRKTTSGGLLVVSIPPVFKSMELTENAAAFKYNEGIFRVKIKGFDNELIQPSAVLELTPSGNYMFVLDKEFETSYKNTIRHYVGDNVGCSVGLAKNNSSYMIKFERDEKQDDCNNALLVKSNSGNIKVLVTGQEFKALEKIVPKRYSRQHLNMSRQIEELFNKMPSFAKSIKSTTSRKILCSDKRSSSDSNLYKKNKFDNSDRLFSDTSALLKKTPSNHYAVVLNKESKKKFINNLKNYLATSPNGLVPIRKTESGEIVIVLSGNRERKEQYGSLKITSSGNIYVSVDEKVIRRISKGVFTEKTKKTNVPSEHIIGLLMYPENKAIATTCNARPNDGVCDGTKCVCDELQFTTRGWLHEFPENYCSSSKSLSEVNSARDNKTSDSSLTCDSHFRCYCLEKKINRKLSDNFPHIIIKPESKVQIPEQNPIKKQCFFVTESICPFHMGRYDCVSNDLLEISGFCNNRDPRPGNISASGQITKIDCLTHANDQLNWDSLNYLPPQLPSFLSGFNYK